MTKSYALRERLIHIHLNARWKPNGVTVAGGNGKGTGINQLSMPSGLYVDDEQTIYVADRENHRIVEWKPGATSGQVVAGGNGAGSNANQLYQPFDVIVDKESDSLIICDQGNKRVVRWPRRNGISGETIISNIFCRGLTMDDDGSLYIIDNGNYEVRRYRRGESKGTLVAGGHGIRHDPGQLFEPQYIAVDKDHAVYVSEHGQSRVTKWVKGVEGRIIVAGGNGKGPELTRMDNPINKGKNYSGGLFSLARHINYGGYTLWRTGLALTSGNYWLAALQFFGHTWDFTMRAVPSLNEHCSKKYGDSWKKFERDVPYILFPYVW
ncbi:unnamed protein product [Rotaria sp. Silwood1]|nr:unnamed protein product [Rotaria sp. Silwood1]